MPPRRKPDDLLREAHRRALEATSGLPPEQRQAVGQQAVRDFLAERGVSTGPQRGLGGRVAREVTGAVSGLGQGIERTVGGVTGVVKGAAGFAAPGRVDVPIQQAPLPPFQLQTPGAEFRGALGASVLSPAGVRATLNTRQRLSPVAATRGVRAGPVADVTGAQVGPVAATRRSRAGPVADVAGAQVGTVSDVEQQSLDRSGLQQGLSLAEQIRGRQLSGLDALSAAAEGRVPSAAELQGSRQLQQAIAGQFALAASARGGAGAQALARQQAQSLAARQTTDVAGQAAILRAQEQSRAREILAQATGQVRAQDTQAAGLGLQAGQAQLQANTAAALQNQRTALQRALGQAELTQGASLANQATALGLSQAQLQADQAAALQDQRTALQRALGQAELTQGASLANQATALGLSQAQLQADSAAALQDQRTALAAAQTQLGANVELSQADQDALLRAQQLDTERRLGLGSLALRADEAVLQAQTQRDRLAQQNFLEAQRLRAEIALRNAGLIRDDRDFVGGLLLGGAQIAGAGGKSA